MSLLLLLQSVSGGSAGSWRAPAAVVPWLTTFQINGQFANRYVSIEGVEIEWMLGGRSLLRCSTVDPAEGGLATGYRPTTEQSFYVTKLDGTIIFDGNILEVTDRP